jgi:hypothetical protein
MNKNILDHSICFQIIEEKSADNLYGKQNVIMVSTHLTVWRPLRSLGCIFSSPGDYDTNPAKRLNEQKIHYHSPMDSHLI